MVSLKKMNDVFFSECVYIQHIIEKWNLLSSEICWKFFLGGRGVKRVCMSNIFFKYCIGQKMGYFYFGLLTGVFFLFYQYRFWAVRKWFHNALNSIFALRLFSDWFASSVNVIIVQYIMRLNGTHWSEVMNTLTIIVFILKGVGHLLSMIRNTR